MTGTAWNVLVNALGVQYGDEVHGEISRFTPAAERAELQALGLVEGNTVTDKGRALVKARS